MNDKDIKKYYINANYHHAKDKKATLLCIHGILSDSNIFHNFVHLTQYIDVYSIDLPGHGLSQGEKGNVRFDDVLVSLHEFIGNREFFLLCFSLSTIYGIHYTAKYNNIKGLILASSLMHPITIIPEYAKRLFEEYKKEPQGWIDITRCIPIDNTRLEEYKNVNKMYSLSYLMELLEKALDSSILEKINVPVLILYGEKDVFTAREQIDETMRLIASKDKTLRIFNTDHWLYDTISYRRMQNSIIVDTIEEWILKKINGIA
ncbi:MAG: alpha/beta hydrolase [Candidatus Nitrosocaldaceae archaeon]